MGRNIIHKIFIFFCLLSLMIPLKGKADEDVLGLYARSAVLMDGDSGRILYGKEEEMELPMASTTKVMTCIIALEEMAGDTVCTVSENAVSQPKVKLGMVKNDQFYLKDLLYSLMLESHNDTAVCIAETVGGSVEGFASKMNEKAQKIGCKKSYFITPNGLDAQDENGIHHTTAKELALIMRYALTQSPKSKEFIELTSTPSYSFTNRKGNKSFSCVNHNALLSMVKGALSGKTGFTGNAGYCYVGAVEQDGKLLIISLLACGWPNHKGYKWVDTKKLVTYGMENFEKRKITEEPAYYGEIPLENGQAETVRVCEWRIESKENGKEDYGCDESAQKIPEVLMGLEEQVEKQVQVPTVIEAPVTKGQKAGWVKYFVDGTEFAAYPIIICETVGAFDYWHCLKQIIKGFLL